MFSGPVTLMIDKNTQLGASYAVFIAIYCKNYQINNNGIGGHAARIGQKPSLENLGGKKP